MLTRAAGSCLPRAPFPDGDRDVNNPGSCCRKVTRVQAIVCNSLDTVIVEVAAPLPAKSSG